MDMRLIWFIFAGFLLGFSVSTLWEWLYFRRRRLRSLEMEDADDLAAEDAYRARLDDEAGSGLAAGQRADGAEIDAGDDWETAYAGPGVYLEFEDDAPAAESDIGTRAADSPGGVPDKARNAAGERRGKRAVDVELPKTPIWDADESDESADASPAGVAAAGTGTPARAAGSGASGNALSGSTGHPGVARSSRPAMPERFRRTSGVGGAAAAATPAETAPKTDTEPSMETARRNNRPAVIPRTPPRPEEPGGDATAARTTAPAEGAQSAAQAPETDPVQSAPVQSDPVQADSAAKSATAGTTSTPAGGQSNPPVRKTENYPDDLAKIKGIGEVYKQRLYAAGIYTWHQIAQTDEETLRAATQAYPSSNVDEWAEQARNLAAKHNRTSALYSGPPPQDLTRIYGIGPVGATTLYRVGICTYAQLAAATPAALAPHFPIAVAGDEPDFEHWIAQAREYSQADDAD